MDRLWQLYHLLYHRALTGNTPEGDAAEAALERISLELDSP